MTPDAKDICTYAIKRGELINSEIYCNPLYPFYLYIIDKYRSSLFYKGMLCEYIDVNPKTKCSDLSDNEEVTFVPMSAVGEKNNNVEYDIKKYIEVKKGYTIFQRGDLLWAKITPCMQNGKSCVVDDMPTEIGFGSTEFHVLRPKTNKIYMPFIWAILSSEEILKAAQGIFSGSAGQQRVPSSFLERFPLIVPEYEVQIKMVKELENRLNQLNKKQMESSKILNTTDQILLDRLDISVPRYKHNLCSAVSIGTIIAEKNISAEYYHPERLSTIEMIKEKREFEIKKLKDVVVFKRNIVSSLESDRRFLGLSGVESNTGELSGEIEEASGNAFLYNEGNVLYARLRPYLNKVLYSENEGICSTEFHVMEVKDDQLLPQYLAAILRSSIILSQTKHMMTGNTHPRISNDDVKNLYIPIPDIEVQRKVVEEITELKINARRLKTEAEKELEKVKNQFIVTLLGEENE